MLLVIDNYDSFTYNLVQYFGELGAAMEIRRNDEISVEEINDLKPSKICISPGPCTPKEAGISCEVIERFGKATPILGVCLVTLEFLRNCEISKTSTSSWRELQIEVWRLRDRAKIVETTVSNAA